MSRRRKEAGGFTLVEVLVALVILGIVITTSLAVFFDRERRIREAGRMALAWQALANEAEIRRRQPFGSLTDGAVEPFVSSSAILESLEATATVAIEEESPAVRRLTLRVGWGEVGRSATIDVYRSDTGGGALW